MKQGSLTFDKNALQTVLFENLCKEQTNRLIDYAMRNVRLIGDAIRLYNSRHRMDDTGNLLDSLCWGVSYRGNLQSYGFYRKQRANSPSYLHEWSKVPDGDGGKTSVGEAFPVWGRELAQKYIKQYGSVMTYGWRVFFAILAPYWGYWEEGFKFKGIRGTRRLQFNVMSQFYDKITNDLKPARTRINVSVPTYTRTRTIKLRSGFSYTAKGSIENKWDAYMKH